MSESRTIAEFTKNNAETIRVALVDLDGFLLCDIRTLSANCGDQGERRPTRAGICIRIGLIADLIAALQDVQREAVQ
ncbi:hypothetical protein [Methylobacterium dankookense]|uniref:Uncharacterized protein n=1 Tax=Methylobacterium dankookense TaxID=560405 RepID=A0A564G217_9HYPH|nr:hypothetical protein [Methylobacterium dankookense]GJD58846.1 hypothetical protein IFDJLNFL_4772 [Methylobacterium dankookense]VUF14182.1 hypothetical protein MTDSW087_03898 [Methylobacterium dankookense]